MGIDAFEAACLAVYVHGKAGDIAALNRGKAGMTASDIANAVADGIGTYLEKQEEPEKN